MGDTRIKLSIFSFHYAKFVCLVKGTIYNVGVNIDPSSAEFGKLTRYELSASNRRMMLVSKPFVHSFITLEANNKIVYFADEIFVFENAKSILYDDSDIETDWIFNGRIFLNEQILSKEKSLRRDDFRIKKEEITE